MKHVACRHVAAIMLAMAALFATPATHAQTTPLRVVLPVSAGSGVETIMRTVAPTLGKEVGQPVVIDNMPGAGGIAGTSAIVKARPDGQTIGVVSNNHVINPSVYKSMPFDSINDITPISILGSTPLVLVVNPKVPAKNVQELIAYLKAKPGAYNFASSGSGTILHLAAEMFLSEAGVQATHVPYKGTGPMVNDLLGGQVEFGVVALPSVQGHLKSGGLRAIGVGSRTRVAAAPDIPTIAEQGLPNYEMEGWFAAIGPAKLSANEVKKMHAAFTAALAAPDVRDALAKQGNTINPGSPEQAAAYFRSEAAKYAKLVKQAGITPE